MTATSSMVDEPELTIRRPRRFWAWPFGVFFVVFLSLAALGGALQVVTGSDKPAEPIIILNGIMASKRDFFDDGKVKQLLRNHNIEVKVTARGSREVAQEVINQKTEQQYDFAFPSGQPAADLIKNHRSSTGGHHRETRLFTSPIVLASFREYAETLVKKEVATAYAGSPDSPFYYKLHTGQFIELGERRETWNSLEIKEITNGNRVLARTSGVCRSNSAATYLGLLAFVKNGGNAPVNETDVDRLAAQLQPLIIATGMAESDLFESYVTPDGKSQGPVVVVYEHQFLAHQIEHQRRHGTPDTERVLLYPEEEFQTDPEFISLKEGGGDRLAELLAHDPDLRRRMLELGYRVLDGDRDEVGTRQLFEYLPTHGIPAPQRTDFTRAELPDLELLERLIYAVDERCQK